MRRAIQLARSGWGRVHPNPLVGAVVVRDGRIVGEGAHQEYGAAHAEVDALHAAGAEAAGATLYVTLEPCAHHGKTPPCTEAIAAAGIVRVVYAVRDPHPQAGGGGEILRGRGIQVESGTEEALARRENALFLRPLETGRPFVALKLALSMDARIAATEGQRTTLTGDAARGYVHRLRAGFDAVLVGRRTVEVDDPLLTVRHGPAPRVPPIRVVVDSGARTSPGSRLVRSIDEAPVAVVCREDAPRDRVAALESAGVAVHRVPAAGDGVDLAEALEALRAAGIRTVLCEGGGRLAASLLRASRVDRLHLLVAPRFIGPEGVPAFPGVDPAEDWDLAEVRALGDDVLMIADRRG